MREEDISKVLSGEADVSAMSNAKFNELVKDLGRVYLARVLNCVDPSGKSDREWTALSCIFNRIATILVETSNNAKMRDALEDAKAFLLKHGCDCSEGTAVVSRISAALATPPRNCDVGTAEEQTDRFKDLCRKYRRGPGPRANCKGCPIQHESLHEGCTFAWAQRPYEAGAE